MANNVRICVDGGRAHLFYELDKWLFECFKFFPHQEGWVVLGWCLETEDDGVCVYNAEFGENAEAAFAHFAEIVAMLEMPNSDPSSIPRLFSSRSLS